MRRPEQLALSLDHFEALHGQHDGFVAVPSKAGGRWEERVLPHDVAADAVTFLAVYDTAENKNVYVSQSGFTHDSRTVATVKALPALFVDLDHYKRPDLAQLTARQLTAKILKDLPDLPTPSLFADSGRGAYLLWILSKPLDRDQLPKWQAVEDALVTLLKPYGADPAARDAARVLRLHGSVNTKTGRKVEYSRIADPVTLKRMEKALLTPQPKRDQLRELMNRPATLPKVRNLFNGYSLAYARMGDLIALAEARAPMTDHRARWVYVFGCAAAWYCPTPEDVAREVEAVARTYFKDGARYTGKRLKTVLDRMTEAKEGGKREWKGQLFDPRFRMRTSTILDLLDVTEEEERQLKTLIGKGEKLRRNNDRREAKRRAAGAKTREEYTALMKEKSEGQRLIARALRAEGLTFRQIAARLGVSLDTAHRLGKG